MNDVGDHDSESVALPRHLAAVAQDVARIAELQTLLFADDLRRLRNRVVGGLAMWLVALCLFIAMLAVALSGLGLYLAHIANTRPEMGLFWVAFASAIVTIGLGESGWLLLRIKRAALDRSCHELHETVKTVARSLSDNGPLSGQ
jgi:hypothetical protein